MKKVFYNVTTKVDLSIHDEWLNWMKTIHIPEVLETGMFLEGKICRMLAVDESDGITYSIQYIAPSMEQFQKYQSEFAEALRNDYKKKYEGKYVIYRSLMEVEEEY